MLYNILYLKLKIKIKIADHVLKISILYKNVVLLKLARILIPKYTLWYLYIYFFLLSRF
jgi:hypothetical protein